ncbi:MAG TPA: methyltransferase domain-containing protein [Kofleriaceae bacterium]
MKANQPETADEFVDAAFALQERGEAVPAAQLYREALQLDPKHHRAMNLLSMILIGRDLPAAIELIQQAIALEPDVAWYHLNLGHAYAESGNDAGAVAAIEASARLDPTAAIPRYDLARQHLRHQRTEPAIAALREVVALEPEHRRAAFLLTSLTGGHADTAPADYVTELFDSYAGTFEAHVTEGLQYQAPEELAGLVAADGIDGARAWQIVDLGCGSGLGGLTFGALAKHLVGSDLSPKMIEIARGRGVYDELHVEDQLQTLGRVRDVDLVLASDVFIYVGALEATFAAAAQAVRPGGRFAFTTERPDADGYGDGDGGGDGFVLRASSRYAHGDGYIRGLAERHGFEVRASADTALRVENGAPIAGTLYLLIRRPAA